MKWFRWHRGTTESAKFAMVAKRASNARVTDVLAVWCVMLEDAADKKHWGICKKTAEHIATILRHEEEIIDEIVMGMAEFDMVTDNQGDGYKINNWDEYQYISDSDPTNAERQKRYRNNRKQDNNALLTRTDTEADTETEEESKKEAATEKITFDFSSGGFSGITPQKAALWKEAFPAVAIEAETKRAAIWLMENPKNKKSNYGKFLSGWFSRTQDRAPKAEPFKQRNKMPSPAGG